MYSSSIGFTNFKRDESFDPYDLGLNNNNCDNIINGDDVINSECIENPDDSRSIIIINTFICLIYVICLIC